MIALILLPFASHGVPGRGARDRARAVRGRWVALLVSIAMVDAITARTVGAYAHALFVTAEDVLTGAGSPAV
jgi:hypothetical protein